MQYNAEQHAAYAQMEESQQPQGGNTKALNLEWVVGFNKEIDMGVHYLADEERTVSFFIFITLTNLCLGNVLHCCTYWSNLRL